MPGRETVNHGMIAKLNITVAEDGTVSAKPSYVPLEIAQAANEFTVLDLSANEAPKTWFEREQKYKFSYFRALYEIEQTVENQVHNVSTEMCFDSLFRVNTGAMASLLNFLPKKKFGSLLQRRCYHCLCTPERSRDREQGWLHRHYGDCGGRNGVCLHGVRFGEGCLRNPHHYQCEQFHPRYICT